MFDPLRNGGDDLVRVERGVEKAPGDADRGERLHHFEVARRGSASQSQPLEVDEQRDPA